MTTILAFLFLSFRGILSNAAQNSRDLSREKREELSEQVCPACGSRHLIKNGSTHNGKPKHLCKSCGRQFVDHPTKITVSLATKQLVDRLLLERISLRGITRVAQVSWAWLQAYVNWRGDNQTRKLAV